MVTDSGSGVLGLVEGNQSATLDCRATVSRVLTLLLRERSEAASVAHGLITLASSLPISSRLAVLTEALGNKLWMPTGLDLDDFRTWLGALGIERQSMSDAMRTVRRLVCSGPATARMSKIARTEALMLSCAR